MCFLRTVVFGQVFLVCKLYNKHLHNRCLKMGAVMQRMKLKLAGKDSSVQISKLKGGWGGGGAEDKFQALHIGFWVVFVFF